MPVSMLTAGVMPSLLSQPGVKTPESMRVIPAVYGYCSAVMSSPRALQASSISSNSGKFEFGCDAVMWQIWSLAPVAATSAIS